MIDSKDLVRQFRQRREPSHPDPWPPFPIHPQPLSITIRIEEAFADCERIVSMLGGAHIALDALPSVKDHQRIAVNAGRRRQVIAHIDRRIRFKKRGDSPHATRLPQEVQSCAN